LGSPSNWLACAGAASPQWWLFGFISNAPPCSDVSVITDASIGATVLDIALNPADWPNTTASELDNSDQSSTYPFTFPATFYLESVWKLSAATAGACGPQVCNIGEGPWVWKATGSSGAMEWDSGEPYNNNFLAVQGPNWGGGASIDNLGPGFAGPFTSYSYDGLRVTSDGTNIGACSYWNSNSPVCGSGTWSGDQATHRQYLKLQVGTSDGSAAYAPSARMDIYVQYIRVWACPGWATGQCNGTVLTGAP
jgi:hypothetical protein